MYFSPAKFYFSLANFFSAIKKMVEQMAYIELKKQNKLSKYLLLMKIYSFPNSANFSLYFSNIARKPSVIRRGAAVSLRLGYVIIDLL